MCDIFEGKVYPFLQQDQIEPGAQIKTGSIPTFFLLPSISPLAKTGNYARHCLAIFIDIIVRRKAMQQNTISWWPGNGHQRIVLDGLQRTSKYGEALDNIFLKLAEDGNIYTKENVWLLKVEDQLPMIADKIKTKQYIITPEKKRSNYIFFFESNHQWNISENGNIGFSLPVHVCPNCNHQKLSTLEQSNCESCDTPIFRKNSPKFSLWFAHSALILDVIEKYHKESSFRTLMTNDGEGMKAIAGTLILGIHLIGDVPFREMVVIENECRSDDYKSTDITRLSLSSVPGHYRCGTLPLEEATQKFTGFANKLWNAAKFVFTHTENNGEQQMDFDSGSVIDCWFTHLLTSTVEELNDLMEQFRINEAIILARKMFQNEFCKWYLELIKPELAKASTRATLRFSFQEILKLLNPFLPTICHRINKLLYQSSGPISSHAYPTFNGNMIFPRQYARVELLKKLIKGTRKTREEMGIKPGVGFFVTLYSKSKKERDMIAQLIPSFNKLTGSSKTIVTDQLPKGAKAAKCEYLNWNILLTFGSDSQRLQIQHQLKHQLSHISQTIEKLESRAPSKKTKQTIQELFKRKERLGKLVHDIS